MRRLLPFLAALGGLAAQASAQNVGMAVDNGVHRLTVFEADSGTSRLLLPDAIVLEINATSCRVAQPIELTLNGIVLGSLDSQSLSCTCRPALQFVTIDDRDLIARSWNREGNNLFGISKQGAPSPPGDAIGTFLSWIRVRLETVAESRTECLFDYGGGDCTVTDICAADSTEDRVEASATVAAPLQDRALVLGSVPLGTVSADSGDCAVTPDGRFGFVTNGVWQLLAYDLLHVPPVPAPPPNVIPISNPGMDVAVTPEGKYLLTCEGSTAYPISIVDAATRREIGTFALGADCSAIDACEDGSVLVASSSTNSVRRLAIDSVGTLSDTGERISVPGVGNVYCAPGGQSGAAVGSFTHLLQSFTIPGLGSVSQRSIGGAAGISGAYNFAGDRFYVLRSGGIEVFGFDRGTGMLSQSALAVIAHPEGNLVRPGVDQLMVHPFDGRLFVSSPGAVRIYDPLTSLEVDSLTGGAIVSPTGMCVRPRVDTDGDGLRDDEELRLGTDPADPDSDDDGLRDGFEVEAGFDPLAPGEELQDPDGDGLNNLEEQNAGTDPRDSDTDRDLLPDGVEVLLLGTDPRKYDTDDDTVGDGRDNCPLSPNRFQADVVHPNGVGDACDDPDGDGVFDLTDNCPDASNAGQGNADGDLLGDACDPLPSLSLKARFKLADLGLTDRPLRVGFDLVDAAGMRVSALAGVRLTLTLTGSAVFEGAAGDGILVAGDGTNRALVEFVDGFVSVNVRDPVAEIVQLGGLDSERLGLVLSADLVERFEADGGGFTHGGANDSWQLGVPTSGPAAAASGRRVWATNLKGAYPDDSDASLVTPDYPLAAGTSPRLEFQSWFDSEETYDVGSVEVSTDGGLTWTIVTSMSGHEQGYFLKSIDLRPFVASTARLRFRLRTNPRIEGLGWYIDDFAMRDLDRKRLLFLEPASDPDGDGLTSEQELAGGTDPRVADTDADTLPDGSDNCPTTPNPSQADFVHPDGIGDACDDPDGDGVFDITDNCPDASNPGQENADGDAAGDACDLFPAQDLRLRPFDPGFGVTDRPLRVVYRLEDAGGAAVTGLPGIRVTLTSSGSAVFGASAASGLLLAGGGTHRVLVELVDGAVALDVMDAVQERIELGMQDTEGTGVRMISDVVERFESDDGGFTHSGTHDAWQYGVPTYGPPGAASGSNVWATILTGPYLGLSDSLLVSPDFVLPTVIQPRLEFSSWFIAREGADFGYVWVSRDAGQTWTTLHSYTGILGGYSKKSFSLPNFRGETVRIAFLFTSTLIVVPMPGWYIDDFVVRNVLRARRVAFLAPQADPDQDGSSNAQELADGSDPYLADSDSDTVRDGMDNCPTTVNPTQADVIHPGGRGDACDDPDADGVFDATDNCPDTANPGQSDADGDHVGDACDLFPSLRLRVTRFNPSYGLTSRPLTVTYRLEDSTGALQESVAGARFTLTLTGPAVFGAAASEGLMLSGGGTGRAVVQFVNGIVSLPIVGSAVSTIALGGEDTDRTGIVYAAAIREDFELNDGGFTHSGTSDLWEHGIPTSGPRAAHSGTRVWATNLDGPYAPEGDCQLVSPDYALPLNKDLRLEFQSWLSTWASLDTGYVEVSVDGGRTWRALDAMSGSHEAYSLSSYDLNSFAGKSLRVRFRLRSLITPGRPGWYIDDFAVVGPDRGIEFLDPAADSDGDGWTNEEEAGRGTDPRIADTDRDGVPDRADNCPRTVNKGQFDVVRPNGIGDACDDPDEDGVPDEADNCSDAPNTLQADVDNDRLGDACDPFPQIDLSIVPSAPAYELTGRPAVATYRLEDVEGHPRPEVSAARFTLTLSGSAVFGGTALQGRLLSGAGTNRALVEFVDGAVALEIEDAVAEIVSLRGVDTEKAGIRIMADVFEDFETSGGGFRHSGVADVWQLGIPTSGPGGAISGQRVWATNLAGSYFPWSNNWLETPDYRLPSGGNPRLEFQSWFNSESCCDFGGLDVSFDRGQTWTRLETLSGFKGGYSLKSYGLPSIKGPALRARWLLTSNDFSERPGWYIDDFALRGPGQRIELLDPALDPDGDGSTNEQELNAGTDPHNGDTDADGVIDGSDNCPLTSNASQADNVHPNGIGDACEDPDHDGVLDQHDNCPDAPNPGQADVVHPNGIGDACDDPDMDGAVDGQDNCPNAGNSDQADRESDGVGDACDICPNVPNPGQTASIACLAAKHDGGTCLETDIDLTRADLHGEIRISQARKVAPLAITFEISAASCDEVQPLQFFLNGGPLGEFHDGSVVCECAPRLQTFVVTDSALLQGLWNLDGNNVLKVIKSGASSPPGAPLGTFVSWVRARLEVNGASETHCLYSLRNDCSSLSQCAIGATQGAIDAVAVVAAPLVAESIVSVTPYTASALPATIPIDGVPDGTLKLCVTGEGGAMASRTLQAPAGAALEPAALLSGGPDASQESPALVRDRATVVQAVCVEVVKNGEALVTINGAACNRPPVARAGVDVVAECSSPAGATVLLDASSSTDPDSLTEAQEDIARYEWIEGLAGPSPIPLGEGRTAAVSLPLGRHEITLRVTDRSGAASTDFLEASVVDTRPPVLAVGLSPRNLWPPNHRMVPVTATVTATDACGAAAVALVSVVSSEPDDAPGPGDGSTVDDIQGAAPGTSDVDFALRAERDGAGSGRVYSVRYRATDASGNEAEATSRAVVPHDQAGVSEPLSISVLQRGAGTVVEWMPVAGALYYNVIRGEVGAVTETATDYDLGRAVCVKAQSIDASTSDFPDFDSPAPGRVFFYLVEYFDGWGSSFGIESTVKPRVVRAGGCG